MADAPSPAAQTEAEPRPVRIPGLLDALRDMPPHQRELLELSLRRRVPDHILARMYGIDEGGIALRRAAALNRVWTALGFERGPEAAGALTALMQLETWAELDEVGETPTVVVRSPPEPSGRWRLPERLAVAGAGTALVVAALGAALAWDAGIDARGRVAEPIRAERAVGADPLMQQRWFVPAGGARGAPFPSGPAAEHGELTAVLRRPSVLRTRPGGGRTIALSDRTAWGSQRVVPVVARRPGWAGVLAPELPNGSIGWVPMRDVELRSVSFSATVDLSARRLVVRRGGEVVRRTPIAAGGRRTPTPTGRFGVTDRLIVRDPGSPYGCCVLALSGHQRQLPRGWRGGDRLAIHAAESARDLRRADTYGAIRVPPDDARWLAENVPLGTIVRVTRSRSVERRQPARQRAQERRARRR